MALLQFDVTEGGLVIELNWSEEKRYYINADGACVASQLEYDRAIVVMQWWMEGCPA